MQKGMLDRLILGLVILAVAVLVTLLVTVGSYLRGRVTPAPVAADVTPAPDDTLPAETALYTSIEGRLARADGTALELTDLRGAPVMLLFWSSWCPDCKVYMESGLDAAFEAARDAGMQPYLVCREGRRGENWESAQVSLAELGTRETTLMDLGTAVYEQLGLRSVPSIAILDGEGRLALATTHMPDEQEVRAMAECVTLGQQGQSEAFLRKHLLAADGSIVSSYSARGNQVAPGPAVYSETQGLMMLYAVAADDQALFDQLLSFVQTRMTVAGLSPWRIQGAEKADVNASLDDLRILEALLLAEENWGGYQQELSYRESALYRTAVQEDLLRDYVTLDRGTPSEEVTLCYLDVTAMERLANRYGKWAPAAEKARTVLAGGVISDAFPLFYPKYNEKTGQYTGDRLQMNEALVAVYHAAKAGIDVTAALDWLETQLSEGAIFASYTLEGRPMAGYTYESPATYALLAQTALICDRDDLARRALARIERRRCYTAPLAGDLGSVTDETHYTFDLVETLLAWQQWGQREEARR